MRLIARFVVPGKPVPKSRPRFGRGHTYTPKATQEQEKKVWAFARESLGSWQADGPIELYCRFFFGSNPRTEVAIWESDYVGTIPPGDADNMVKLVADSLAPFFNDRQIVRLTAEKVGKDA